MSLILSYDPINDKLAEDIPRGRLDMLNKLLREGRMAEINQKSWNLLADYNEGKFNKGRGRPIEDNFLLAEHLHYEFNKLRSSGEGYNQALKIIADKNCMSDKNAERLITAYNKYEKEVYERCADIDW